ncbi:metallophosphoesterase family protein [Bacillus sp. SD088]|uniref:metallophosphoesterase family protein n=1 Tax=Bacillus sp. SD088 TaxID=2782012 RepID=UPI001A96C002|nr:metallophosphoesterase family protein [Bacillus sp. SD088]MBO0992553.1 metallophosphoesterase family protein [Bacillus sp. SD088]
MKVAFLSDIHGNATALEAVIEDIKDKRVDQIFVLGDICFRGPEPKRSLELVQSLGCDVIKGNADEWVVRGVQEGEVPSQALEIMQQEREWTHAQLGEADVAYLQNLPTEINTTLKGINIHAFHATPNSLFDVVPAFASNEQLQDRLMIQEADVYLYGHIHTAYIRFINGKTVVNLGSVGLPFDGVNKASYCLIDLEDGRAQSSIVRVNYNIDETIHKLQQSDYPNKDFLINIWSSGRV